MIDLLNMAPASNEVLPEPEPIPALTDVITQCEALVSSITAAQTELTQAQSVLHDAGHAIADAIKPATKKTAETAALAAQDQVTASEDTLTTLHATFNTQLQILAVSAREYHAEQARDKRAEIDLPCPTWAPMERLLVDPVDRSRVIVVTYQEGCKCDHMAKRHESEIGNPWCTVCQDAHRDGTPLPATVSVEVFVTRIVESVTAQLSK